jgi:Leucine-rich repeat (LRR) protein
VSSFTKQDFSQPALLQEILLINGTYLSGSIPSVIGLCTKLKVLSFWFSDLSGTLPTELGSLSMLEYFDVRKSSKMTGSIPKEIFDLPNLRFLHVAQTKIHGVIPEYFCRKHSAMQLYYSTEQRLNCSCCIINS